jgi:uncharacterized protein YegL
MEGNKIMTVKRSFENIIHQIDEGDSYNIIHFSDGWIVYSEQMVDASLDAKEKAYHFISNISADGGTNINEALLEAIDLFGEDSYKIPIIIFLTDGLPTTGVTNTNSIRNNIQNANKQNVVIHTLGYGDDHDSDFLKAVALENEGMYRYIKESTDAGDLFEGHYTSISNPLLRNLKFNYSSGTSEIIPDSMRILFEGSEAVILGRYGPDMNKISAGIEVTSEDGSKYFNQTFTVKEEGGPEFISRLWAHRKIETLLDKLLVEGANEEIEKEIASLGINYSFVTPYTSLVLVLEREEGNVEGNEAIPEGAQYQHEYDPYNEWEYEDHVYSAPQYDMASDPYRDTDLDGMYDYWEAQYQIDPFVNNAMEDSDNDGFTNIQEYQNNTNPYDSLSHPAVSARAPDEAEAEAPFQIWVLAVPVILALIIIGIAAFFILIKGRSYNDFTIYEE